VTVTLSRRTIILAGAAIVLVAAAVITWILVSGGKPTSPAADAAPVPARTGAETAYLDQVKTAQAPLSDDEALRLGRDQCKGWDSLRAGESVDFLAVPGSLEQMARDGKLAPAHVHSIENASVQYLCPANLAYSQGQKR
jgi:hypothetical protein